MTAGRARFSARPLTADTFIASALGARNPVYCAGLTANSPVRNGPGTVGFPVVLGDVTVSPGDIVVGDRDGVVVVPQSRAEDVLAALEGIKAAEHALEAESFTAGW